MEGHQTPPSTNTLVARLWDSLGCTPILHTVLTSQDYMYMNGANACTCKLVLVIVWMHMHTCTHVHVLVLSMHGNYMLVVV